MSRTRFIQIHLFLRFGDEMTRVSDKLAAICEF